MNEPVDSRLSQERVRRLYDWMSGYYDLLGGWIEGRARERGIALAGVRDGEIILEVAAGTGLLLADLARRNPGGRTVGIDLSERMLAKAARRVSGLPGVELLPAGAQALPFPSGCFDLLVNSYMFDLMPFAAMPAILAEFRRVLAPTGRMVLINMTVGEKPGSGVFARLYRISPSLMGGCRGVRMAEMVEEAGFRVMIREYHQQMGFPSEVILADR